MEFSEGGNQPGGGTARTDKGVLDQGFVRSERGSRVSAEEEKKKKSDFLSERSEKHG